MEFETDLSTMDGKVMFVATLVGLGITTVEKVIELWRRGGVDEETLRLIRSKAKSQLAKWQAYGEVN